MLAFHPTTATPSSALHRSVLRFLHCQAPSPHTQSVQAWEIRVLFATEAFGLGCDISFIKFVVQWGNADSFLCHEQHWGRGGRGRETLVEDPPDHVGKRCKCIWFTSLDIFGPLATDDNIDQSAKHPFTNATPVCLKRAVSARKRLFAISPALFHLANPEGWECVRVRRRKELRPDVGGSIRHLGGEWHAMKYPGCALPPWRCCRSCVLGYMSRFSQSRDILGASTAQLAFEEVVVTHALSESSIATRATQAFDILRPQIAQANVPTIPVSKKLRESLRNTLEVVRKRLYLAAPVPGFYRCETNIITDSLIEQMVRSAHRIMGCSDVTVAWMSRTFSGWLVPLEHNDRILGAVEGWKAQAATEDAKAEKKKAKHSMRTRVCSKADIKDTNTLRSHASTFVHSPSPSPSSSYPIQIPCASRPLALMTINTVAILRRHLAPQSG